MPTMLRCVKCGAEVPRRETLLGQVQELPGKRCVCATCAPGLAPGELELLEQRPALEAAPARGTLGDGPVEARDLQRLHDLSFALVVGAVLSWGAGLSAMGSLVERAAPLALFLLVFGYAGALALLYFGMSYSCEAKGHSQGWAIAGVVLGVLVTPILSLLIVALLPDRNRELREALAPATQRLYRPALYSMIIGLPMPYLGLPIAIYALRKIRSTGGRLRGGGIAVASIALNVLVICGIALLVATQYP
ncbi:MAG: hypothetical protein HY721_29145 [Planctomycetes bacterium]|nr:hypothetical protein [Planctomycetota bacterium]